MNVHPSEMLVVAPLEPGAWAVELVLAATAVVGAIVGSAWVRVARVASTAGLAVAGVLAVIAIGAEPGMPLGPHLVVDGRTAAARLILTLAALATAVALPRRQGAAAPSIVLATLGHLMVAAAVTLGGLLVGLLLAILGTGRARAAAGRPTAGGHRLATTGFAMVGFAGILWCGLGGDTAFAAAREGIASRPSLPPVAVPLLAGLMLVGSLLALLGSEHARPDVSTARRDETLAAWASAAPLAPLLLVASRLVLPATSALVLPAVHVLAVLGALLALAALGAALTRRDLAARLRTAAPAQLGLAWLGIALAGPLDAVQAAVGGLLVAVPAHVAALLILEGPRKRGPGLLLATLLLLGLAAVPPWLGWRLRFVVLEALLSGASYLACALAAGVTLLGYLVYLAPLPSLWRTPDRGGSVGPLGRLAAWSLAVVALLWAAGIWPHWPL